MDLRTLHRRLHEMRVDRGLSVDEMARRLGVSPMTVDRVETGPYTLSVATVADWAAVCGMKVDFVFAVDPDAKPEPQTGAGLHVTDALPGAHAHARSSLPWPGERATPGVSRAAAAVASPNNHPVTAPPGQTAPLRQPATAARAGTSPTPASIERRSTAPGPLPRAKLPAPEGPADDPSSAELVLDPATGPSDPVFDGPFRTGRVIGEPTAAEPTPPSGWGRAVQLPAPRASAFRATATDPATQDTTGTSETERVPLMGALPRSDATAPTAQDRTARPPKLTSGATRTAGSVIPRAYAGGNKRQDAVALDEPATGGRALPPSSPRPPEDAQPPEVMLGALRTAARAHAEEPPPPPEPKKGVLKGLVNWFTGSDEK